MAISLSATLGALWSLHTFLTTTPSLSASLSALPSTRCAWPTVRAASSLYGVTGTPVGLFREGRDAPDISCPVEAGAAATVKEPDNGVLKFGKYRAFEWKPMDSRPLITGAVIYPPLEPRLSLDDRRGNQ
jgi:hypothetical protein